MKFAFIAKHRGIWPAALCGALGVSRVLCMADAASQRAQSERRGAWRGRCAAFFPAIEPMVPGGCGTTCWPKTLDVACTDRAIDAAASA